MDSMPQPISLDAPGVFPHVMIDALKKGGSSGLIKIDHASIFTRSDYEYFGETGRSCCKDKF
jgi:hypothetical protein